jgi:uncharacterized protein YaiI (UPF0178 family)
VIAPALDKIADYIKALAEDMRQGNVVASDDIRLAATRLNAQADTLDACGE